MMRCVFLQVTVLFADIAGYTALSTQVEPEEVREQLELRNHMLHGLSCGCRCL